MGEIRGTAPQWGTPHTIFPRESTEGFEKHMLNTGRGKPHTGPFLENRPFWGKIERKYLKLGKLRFLTPTWKNHWPKKPKCWGPLNLGKFPKGYGTPD